MSGVVVIGAGPGIGRAVAARFAKEGLPVGLIARSDVGTLGLEGVPVVAARADVADRDALDAALDRITDAHGIPDVVVYNAAIIQADAPGELSVQGHLDAWAVNVVGALNAAAKIAPAMAARGAAAS